MCVCVCVVFALAAFGIFSLLLLPSPLPPLSLPSLTSALQHSLFHSLPLPIPHSSTFFLTSPDCRLPPPKQALFHQPSFRRMVLEYTPLLHLSLDNAAIQPHKLCVTFVQELRSLFSLMIHSQKKYVDPGAVVKVCHTQSYCIAQGLHTQNRAHSQLQMYTYIYVCMMW